MRVAHCLLVTHKWLKVSIYDCVQVCASLLPCCEMPDIGVLLLLAQVYRVEWDTREGVASTCGREETEGA